MEASHNVEEVLDKQLTQLNQLEITTTILDNKYGLRIPLEETHASLYALSGKVQEMSQQLTKMKEQNEEIKKLHSLYKRLDEKIIMMTEHIPVALSEQLEKISSLEDNSPVVIISKSSPEQVEVKEVLTNITNLETTSNNLKDCRKALFREAEDNYTIELLTQEEFAKIPKYMIGRQTLSNVNAFVETINQIMKAKYGLLALGKLGARKKGELDLFMHFKKEEIDIKGSAKEKIYFFTGEDYKREIKARLDKTKLNLMTVLRHCKRLQEMRDGKHVRYQIVT